jgi:hypothetical protein
VNQTDTEKQSGKTGQSDRKIKSIDWLEVPEKNIQDLDLLPHQLTDLQIYIITGLHREGAVTTRGAWKRTLAKKYQMKLTDKTDALKNNLEKTDSNVLDRLKKILSQNSDNSTMALSVEYFSYSDMVQDIRKKGLDKNELLASIESGFQISDSSKPAYETVLNNLEILEDKNIVMRKSGEGKNAKYLWTLNPRFFKMYEKRRKQIIEDLEALDTRTLNFYNISVIYPDGKKKDELNL